jgi:hypothetical protein
MKKNDRFCCKDYSGRGIVSLSDRNRLVGERVLISMWHTGKEQKPTMAGAIEDRPAIPGPSLFSVLL